MSRALQRRKLGAFTLMELLAVVALVAVLSVVLGQSLVGGSKTAALQSGQTILANFVDAARSRAVATNRNTRILVRNTTADSTYRRLLVLIQLKTVGASTGVSANWEAVTSVLLPSGIYLLPDSAHLLAGFFPNSADWQSSSAPETLRSSAFASSLFGFQFESAASESWEYIGFTPNGTMETSQGSLIIANGREIGPGAITSPVELTDPQAVRGIQLSTYGVPRLINDRTGF